MSDCDHPVITIDPDTAEFVDDGVLEIRGDCDTCGMTIQETYYRDRQEEVEGSVG